MRYGSILPVLLAASMSSPQLSELPSNVKHVPATGRFFAQDHETRNERQPEARHCAHIVISEAPGIDPDMVKKIPRKFGDNMPMLQVPPPCQQDSHATN